MAKFRSIRNSFLGGQISPTCVGRTDLPQYAHACELLRNMIPMLSGGAYQRPGTQLVASLSVTTDHPPHYIPFIAGKGEAYALFLGHTVGAGGYLSGYRFFGSNNSNFSSVTVSGTPPYNFQTASTFIGNSGTNADDEVFQVQYCQSVDTVFLTHPLHKPQTIKRTSLDHFTIADFDSGLSGAFLANAYPYLNQNTTSTTMKVSATTGTGRTLTASAAYFDANHIGSIFRIDDGAGNVGAIQITSVTSSLIATGDVIVTFGDTLTHVTWWESAWSNFRGWPRSCAIFQQRLCMGGTTHQPDTVWFSQTAGFYSFSTLNGTAPAGVVIVRGASITVSGGYINYPVDDSEGDGQKTGPTGIQPFRITLSQNSLDQIQWLSPDKELLVGTYTQEWIMSPQNGQFDIANSPTVLQSKYGSDYLMASRIGYELIFPLASQDEVRAYQYNYIDASFFAEPVQLLFDQYPVAQSDEFNSGRRKFRRIEWDVTRQTLWCLDTAGNFFGMTRDRKLGVTSWHTHQFGGYDTTKGVNAGKGAGVGRFADPSYNTCDGSVISFTVVPNPLSGINDIWLVVKRSGSGTTFWCIERMIGKSTGIPAAAYSTIAPGASSTEPLMIDAATIATDNGDPANKTYTVDASLNGYSLTGAYYSGTKGIFKITSAAVVATAAVLNSSLPSDYGTISNIVTLGLPFTAIIQPTRLDVGSVIGTAQGAIKRINRVFIRFFKSMSAKIGAAPNGEDTNTPETVVFNNASTPLGSSPTLFTGDKKVLPPTTYDREGYLYIQNDQPFPFCVVGLIAEGEEFD